DESIHQEAVGDGVGVNHPKSARREQLDPGKGIDAAELQRVEQAAEQRGEEENEGGDEMGFDDWPVDELAAREFNGHLGGWDWGHGLLSAAQGWVGFPAATAAR